MKGENVYVGLSGGVDSSVAALRLKEQGYAVTGVFIKVWQPEFLSCNWERERLDAMRVAAHLDIPFLTLDAADDYKHEVADYMIREYQEGRTPNPDVMCNQHIKFGSFLKFAKKHGVEKIATGHYARVEKREERYALLRGIDQNKDQSYFLWTLTMEQLQHVIFPVGDTQKEAIRKEAGRAGLPVSMKQDSQGICFLGQVDMKDFLSHYAKPEEGALLSEDGKVIGRHDGSIFYTIGQRHGFHITVTGRKSVPHYVLSKDLTQNTVTVSTEPPRIASKDHIHLTAVNRLQEKFDGELLASCRYRQKPFRVRVDRDNGDECYLQLLDTVAEYPSPGQSCVLYEGDECVGGGIITAPQMHS